MWRKVKTGVVAASDRGVGTKDPLKAVPSMAAFLLASALVLAIFAFPAARPAEAEGNKTCSVNPACAAVGWFWPYGERLAVSDNRTDGYGAVMRFEFYSPDGTRGDQGRIYDTHNDGNPTNLNLSIPEGWTFAFTVCLMNDYATIGTTCSRWTIVKT
jgi:hypothetical protein